MKILVVSHEFPPIGGGGANACYFLTKGFAERGHQVTLVTANYQGLPEEEVNNGVHIIRVNALRCHREHCSFKEMLSYLMKALPLAERLYKMEKFNICLCFFGIPSGPIGYVLKKKYKLPYVIRFGGGDVPGFQKRFTKVYKLIGPAIKVIWKNADALIANSQELTDMALGFYNKRDFQIIYNGVDIETFYPKKKEMDEEFKILFASRLIERKGLQYVIPQLKKIQQSVDKKVRLIVVGDGPYRDELENLVKQYEAQEMILFEGQKNREEMLSYYQNADLFILPSNNEGMPNVVLEAMACGLPIIMTPCGGSSALIEGNGYIAERNAFGDVIVKMINNISLCRDMGGNSKRRIDSFFTWDKVVEKYLSIMGNITKR